MKKNEIALIIVVVIVSALASYFVLGSFLKSPDGESKRVKTIQSISPTIETPSTKIFNENAIDPTIMTQIGDPSNQQPFNQSAK